MRRSWKAGGVAVLLTLVSVALAYQLPATIELDLGRPFPSALVLDNFHDAEAGYRWSRATSHIVFKDPGGYRDARVELELSGFRPPGIETPLVVAETTSTSARLRPSRRVDWHTLETRTTGWWSSDLSVLLRSETFSPGAGDERSLGVRVHRARLTLPGGAVPPLRQLAWCALIVLLIFRWRRERPRSLALAVSTGVALAVAYALARSSATILVPVAGVALAALSLIDALTPALTRFAGDTVARASRALATSGRAVINRRGAALAMITLASVWMSYRMTPRVEIDLGSGESAGVARRFGPLDRDGELTFRRALAGATLDLRDFGSLAPWMVTVHASARGAQAPGVVLAVAERELVARVGSDWAAYQLDVPASPLGWRSSNVLTFPGLGAGTELRIDRVVIERGASAPSPHVLALVLAATFLIAGALRSTLAGGVYMAMVVTALARAPVVTVPLLSTLCVGAIVALSLGAWARGFFEAASARDILPALSPLAVSIALGGFAVSFAALASPLYVGGHYGFHTDIAEEIWQGRFLHYYLPYPGSMLSRQPQWDHVIVPHSCMFHTAAAPLAALPRAWFHVATKLLLAALSFWTALAAAAISHRVASPKAACYTAVVASFVPTGFQLLGLGHLMTLFGTWASALALAFIIISLDRLGQRPVFAWAVALLSLCFLSYTGSLLFASIVIAASALFLRASNLAIAKRLAGALLLGWAFAFVLYYMHWALPFIRDSLPALLSESGSDARIDIPARLVSEPRKLGYTFGSAWVPLIGLAGLWLARRREPARATLLYCWAGVLVVFSAADVWFNFLLKHHYFTYPVIAVGIGLALAWLHEKGWLGKAITAFCVVSLLWMGLHEALAVASGAI